MPRQKIRSPRDALGQQLVDLLTLGPSELAPGLASLPPERLDAVLEQATAHGVAPLLRNRLVEQGLFRQLPEAARDALDTQYQASSVQAMARYHELGVILERCAEADIPVIALKGIYLAKAVYPEPGLRPMADMDLLFRVQDLEAVQTILLQLGYSREDADRPISDYLPTWHQLPPFVRADATSVEVHMVIERPQSPFSIDHEGIWKRARSWPLGGRPLLAMAPEDLLLHVCLHAMYHHHGRIPLSALIDIAWIIKVEPLDWEVLVARAKAWRAPLPTFLGLELARRLLGCVVPERVVAALAPGKRIEPLLAMSEQTLLAPRTIDRRVDGVKTDRGPMLGYLGRIAQVQELPTWNQRLRALVAKAFPERAALERQYPKLQRFGLIPPVYLVHWLVVAGRFSRAMVRNGRYWWTFRNLDRRWLP